MIHAEGNISSTDWVFDQIKLDKMLYNNKE